MPGKALHDQPLTDRPACRYNEEHRVHRDQDDDEPIQRSGDGYDDESAGVPLTFEQQKAELKRRIMQPQPKKQKVKKLKRDQVYNPDGKRIDRITCNFSCIVH